MPPTWSPSNEPAIDVLFVEADDGPAGATAAFAELERRLGGPKGRRFYGSLHAGVYRACVARRDVDDAAALGLGTATLRGGTCLRTVYRGAFAELHRVFATVPSSVAIDPDRPCVEYYRREGEVVLLAPIRS